MGGRGWGRKGWRINMFLGPYLVGPYLVEGCDFKTERWGMECKGRRTMKCCVFYCEEPTSSSSFFPSRLVHSWSVCRGRASPDITPDLWNSQVGVEWWWWWWEWWLWWSSSRSSPHVKMVKQRTSTPQHPPTPGRKNKKQKTCWFKCLEWVKCEVGRRVRAVVADEGGNESQGCRLGAKTNGLQSFK